MFMSMAAVGFIWGGKGGCVEWTVTFGVCCDSGDGGKGRWALGLDFRFVGLAAMSINGEVVGAVCWPLMEVWRWWS